MDQIEKSKPLRVLFVNRMACLERGGGETFDLEISRHLALAGVKVSFLSGAPLMGSPPMPLEGARVLHTPWLRRFPWDKLRGGWRVRQAEFAWFEWRAARWVARHAAEFDIVQICELPNLVYWLKKHGVKVPLVMRLTAPNYHDPRGGVQQADALIASGTTIQKLRAQGTDDAEVVPPDADLDRTSGSLEGRPLCRPLKDKLFDVPNAVDADLFRPQASDFRKRHGIAAAEFVALYVARFQAFKNHAMLLDAFARFAKERPASRLVLVGSGPLRERTEQQAAELGIADRVLFLGEVPYREVPGVYAAADVKVISSDYESFCFAAIEAMSTGLPVLTTDCAWVPRLVADGAGIIVPVGDAEAFAAGLKRLADNPALRQRLGATGRQHVLERHTWPASAGKLLRLYQNLAASRPR
jgi:glycosyltransferase involved in cell wall biosynthesis